jgi:hypothetical protein
VFAIAYRDKKLSGVFVRFSCAASMAIVLAGVPTPIIVT